MSGPWTRGTGGGGRDITALRSCYLRLYGWGGQRRGRGAGNGPRPLKSSGRHGQFVNTTYSTVVIWVTKKLNELIGKIYFKILVRAFSKVLHLKFIWNTN